MRTGEDRSWLDDADDEDDNTTEGDDTTTTFGLQEIEFDDVTMKEGIMTLEEEDEREVIEVDPILTYKIKKQNIEFTILARQIFNLKFFLNSRYEKSA